MVSNSPSTFIAHDLPETYNVFRLTVDSQVQLRCLLFVVPMLYQHKNATMKRLHNRFIFFVVWGGIEPPTQGFSVLCSTD
jgi:hypothetical protein